MKLTIHLKEFSYDVTILNGCLQNAGSLFNLNRKVLIVSDNGVPEKYVSSVLKQCKEGYVFIFSKGEESKNIYTYQHIMEYLIAHEFTRSDAIVAVGGGVVGDLAGFVASTYMRGITFYNIPTTLLSQVDSSIGGKTAIDFLNTKNIIGSFYQPSGVLIDPETLSTLSKRQLHSGLVEAIKMASTFDEELFKIIEDSTFLNNDLETIIYRSLLLKKKVVEEDSKENGIRKVLNFGHTIGHGIESASQLTLLHGESVGIGMLYMCSEAVKIRLISLLKKYDLPTTTSLSKHEILPYIIHDKKMNGSLLSIIYVPQIGTYQIKTIAIQDIETYL